MMLMSLLCLVSMCLDSGNPQRLLDFGNSERPSSRFLFHFLLGSEVFSLHLTGMYSVAILRMEPSWKS